ncbi:MAG: indole-3-glycerol-phosphate synthase [Deltaproteobacteria bacterium]|nr:indole-3-glycerol-phosphate synthase [Deltaproteobacteria bacterium]
MTSPDAPKAKQYLAGILDRKRVEVRRRQRHAAAVPAGTVEPRGGSALAALRRPPGGPPRVIAEVKFRSPSRGQIHRRVPGEAVRVARQYEQAGVAAVSVLADRVGFGGGALDVRRVAAAIEAPVLFKEFVLDECQVELARSVGASLVLLLVRALSEPRLRELTHAIRAAGMEPVVEAANAVEVATALAVDAQIIGVNARDLSTFTVDPAAARLALEGIPEGRVAVYMSGVKDRPSFDAIAAGRADAVLIGEGLMRAEVPGDALRALLGSP